MKMGYTLTRRPYLLLGFFHMLIGVLLLSTGIIWLLMTFFYWPKADTAIDAPFEDAADLYKGHPWKKLSEGYQAACWIIYTVQIWTGFWVWLLQYKINSL